MCKSVQMGIASLFLALICLSVYAQDGSSGATNRPDGAVKQQGNEIKVWHKASWRWIDVASFWQTKLQEYGGAELASNIDLSDITSFEENAVVLYATENGGCLMVWSQQQWRQATDVFGWDPLLKGYPGCNGLP